MTFAAFLMVFAPLLASALIAVRHLNDATRRPGWIACAATATSFVIALGFFAGVLFNAEGRLEVPLWTWFRSGDLVVDFGLLIDPLSSAWSLVVTGVGSLIFVYSLAYMDGARGYARYFAFLGMFLFSMLALVLGDNLVVTFLGWEGVGLCSYLLIGFDYHKDEAAAAGRKAFLVNRIGDVGFLIGMFAVYQRFGTFNYVELSGHLSGVEQLPVWLPLCFFLGAVGKSAQLPLMVWLPDAMAGPTPVSALIHAATMVTAGVYLVCRLSLLFALGPGALDVVAWVGAATALFAALIALRQRDIKRVLAYSTVSQLGYMFLACGVGAFSTAAFHVTTHAFFKALLFLGAGSVIHALRGEQDLFKMGGLRHALPHTWRTMWCGALALAGIFPFAGFFSKDEILALTLASHHPMLFAVALLTALLTAFYTARMMALCFYGSSRVDPHLHPHESPPLMLLPLKVLAVLALAGGALLGVEILHYRPLHWFLEPVLEPAARILGEAHPFGPALAGLLLVGTLVLAILSWKLGKRWFLGDGTALLALEIRLARPARWIAGRFYLDELYRDGVVAPLRAFANACGRFDLWVIDGFYNGLATATSLLSSVFRLLQTGVVHTYAFWFLAGAAVLLYLAR